MKSRLIEKNQALELRKSGNSLSEISKKLGVSKGLLSLWFKDLQLSSEEILTLKKHGEDLQGRGRLRAAITNKFRGANHEKEASEIAKKKFSKLKSDPTFLIGISLYWARGAKQGNEFQFINSDPDMISFMYTWIQKYLGLKKEDVHTRLFIEKGTNIEQIEGFWKDLLEKNEKIRTSLLKQRKNVLKSPDYKGSLGLSLSGLHYLRLMKAWQKLFIESLLSKK
jgi:hypothetical protein